MTKEKVIAGAVMTLKIGKAVLMPIFIVGAFILTIAFGTIIKVLISTVNGK